MNVCHEVLRPAGEELMGGSEVPGDATYIGVPVCGGAGDGRPGRLTKGAAASPKASPKHIIITNRCIYDKYESKLYHYVK